MPPAVRLSDVDPRQNGFDTVRLLAAAMVLISHAFALTGFVEPMEGWGRGVTLGTTAVGAFFVISGLLITMSAERRAAGPFLSQRARRLMPALIVCVLICAALGAFLTSFSMDEFWTARPTLLFLGNIMFYPSPQQALPGVFENYPVSAMNGSLWTLKFEVACYAISFVYARIIWNRRILLLSAWIASLVFTRLWTGESSGILYYVDTFAFLFQFYGAGMLFYAFRERLILRRDWALAALACVILAPFVEIFTEAAATLGAYALIVLAYQAPPWFRRITEKGDISYGVYLYAFPIQQLLVPICLTTTIPWLTNIALALPLTLLAGTLSWLVVERKFLSWRTEQTASARAF